MENLACVFCDKKPSSKTVELRTCVYLYVCVPTFEKENAKKKGRLSAHRRLHDVLGWGQMGIPRANYSSGYPFYG